MEQYVPNCPFLSTKPTVDSIESNLEYLLSHSNREQLGKKCREYAIQKHDIVKVAEKCLERIQKNFELVEIINVITRIKLNTS